MNLLKSHLSKPQYTAVDNIGITSSTCRHYTLINSIMCSDSYPIPILSLFFLYHPYIPPFLIRRIFHFLVYSNVADLASHLEPHYSCHSSCLPPHFFSLAQSFLLTLLAHSEFRSHSFPFPIHSSLFYSRQCGGCQWQLSKFPERLNRAHSQDSPCNPLPLTHTHTHTHTLTYTHMPHM